MNRCSIVLRTGQEAMVTYDRVSKLDNVLTFFCPAIDAKGKLSLF